MARRPADRTAADREPEPPYDRDRKFSWAEGDITVTRATPDTAWMTTFSPAEGTESLVRDVEGFLQHVEQRRGDQTAEEYIETFLRSPQSRFMPEGLRAALIERGVLVPADAPGDGAQAEAFAIPKNATREEKWAYAEGDIQITKATPETAWMTTYINGSGGESLVVTGEDMLLHCRQNGARRWRSYLREFMRGPQGDHLPGRVRRELAERGIVV